MKCNKMGPISSELRKRTWSKDSFFISTDASLIPVPTLNEMFAREDFYWGSSLPDEVMREMLDSSLCFGLYKVGSEQSVDTAAAASSEAKTNPDESALTFLGLARCVTDFTTFLYVTDVWIGPENQGKGLGRWLIRCVQEVVEDMPYLRRSILFTADWKRSVPFYKELMDMTVVEFQHGEGLAMMERKGKGHPGYGKEGSGYSVKSST
ncbi:gcn5-related n-acetyltransferase [Ilyonectria sp. MPI-CAGE-AT-0026]|nr:gcn5-related n-acetyltransferase [Ilyonectria sp. MPI-CAGE-AT-0026]